jgi:hypothetical protein
MRLCNNPLDTCHHGENGHPEPHPIRLGREDDIDQGEASELGMSGGHPTIIHDPNGIVSVFLATQTHFEKSEIRTWSRLQPHPFQKQIEQVTSEPPQHKSHHMIDVTMEQEGTRHKE